MITLNSLIVSAPQRTTAAVVEKSVISDDISDVSGVKTADPHISDQAKTLSALFDSASRYVVQEHVKPFSAYVKGLVTTGSWINIEKYNNYLFDKAARAVVAQASEQGVTVGKEGVVAHLKSANADIANLKFDNDGRCWKLGGNSALSHLTPSDLDSITDIYIIAKEQGLDINAVGSLASDMGSHRYYGDTLGEGDIFPIGWDFSETDPEKIEAARLKPTQSRIDKGNEIKEKLQGDLGLGSDFINYLLNPKIALGGLPESTLNLLSSLIDILNQKDKAS